MRNGFIRVAAVVPPVQPADVEFNVRAIEELIVGELAQRQVDVAVFPEMCITGYTCADLFHSDGLLDAVGPALERVRAAVKQSGVAVVVGYPKSDGITLLNCARFLSPEGESEVKKTYIPAYNEFYERRWWDSAKDSGLTVIEYKGVRFGIEICEDLWVPTPPSASLALGGAEVILNLSASDDIAGKYTYLRDLVVGQSSRCLCAYVYAGAGFGESSTDLVFDGKGIIAENGKILAEKPRWDSSERVVIADVDVVALRHDRLHMTTFADCAVRELAGRSIDCVNLGGTAHKDDSFVPEYRHINAHPFLPPEDESIDTRCEEILSIQTAGLARRLDFIKGTKLVVGISGGLDSTLALLVAVRAFDRLNLPREGIIGVTMPGFGTTGRTYANACTLIRSLGATLREVSILPAVTQHFADIGHNPELKDVTYENSQARERTQILMDIANKEGAIVLGTGDLSELALGWATYNGDHMSMYGVNSGVPKTLVNRLVAYQSTLFSDPVVKSALEDILATPISPELLPADSSGEIAQRTEELVGPYELHDFFLYYTLRFGTSPRRLLMFSTIAFDGKYGREVILKWLRVFYRRFFSQQFKRSCMPDGPKVGSVCLSPRGDWRMPSDVSSRLWLAELDEIE